MAELVRITDVAPRDGLQNEAGFVPTEQKLELIERLIAAGVDEVEITSFVSPKWIPQLSDAEDVASRLRGRIGGRKRDGSNTSRTGDPVFSVLVPNEKGLERALALHDPEGGFPLKIALFTAASETFSRRNTNATIAETIERFRPIVPRATDAGMDIRLYISCAVACPFEGAIAPAQVRRVADMLLDLFDAPGARSRAELDLGDTIGVATTAQIDALLNQFSASERAGLTLHLHDTFGRASDCVRAALAMGVRSFDGATGGLGGCPYASTPQRRAPGNISTEALVSAVRSAGFATHVNDASLQTAAEFARAIVHSARAAQPQTPGGSA
jgi:hydroxymethylglutaryl-CoA lyase